MIGTSVILGMGNFSANFMKAGLSSEAAGLFLN